MAIGLDKPIKVTMRGSCKGDKPFKVANSKFVKEQNRLKFLANRAKRNNKTGE